MATSPAAATAPSQKRPLEEPSSPSGLGDQPDAKRPALDKVVKEATDDLSNAERNAHIQGAGAEGSASGPHGKDSAEQGGTRDDLSDTMIPDAPNSVLTHPIQSTTSSNNGTTSHGTGLGHQDETGWLHLRAIISSAEAATVIGKGGENVTLIRRMSGAKCTVSDYSRGAVERILTVSGLVDAVAKVCYLRHLFFIY
jgi:heterogeneous nuclear rnp K-like protein